MAKPVKFSTKPKKPKEADTSFDFGFNVLNKTQKRAYKRKLGKSGNKPGGGS
jgi:hypothetical protein